MEAMLPTVSARLTEAPPCSSPKGCWVRSLTGMLARRKSGPTSVKRMPRKPGMLALPRAVSSSGVELTRQMLIALV